MFKSAKCSFPIGTTLLTCVVELSKQTVKCWLARNFFFITQDIIIALVRAIDYNESRARNVVQAFCNSVTSTLVVGY